MCSGNSPRAMITRLVAARSSVGQLSTSILIEFCRRAKMRNLIKLKNSIKSKNSRKTILGQRNGKHFETFDGEN